MRFGTTDIISIEKVCDIDIAVKTSISKLFDELDDFFSYENITNDTRWKYVSVGIDSRLDGKINIVKLCESEEWPKIFNPRIQIISKYFDLGDDPEVGYQIDVIYNDHMEEKEQVNEGGFYIKKDAINPDHYKNQTSLECIEAMEIIFGRDAVIDFCRCNAWKYIWRWKNKNGTEDLDKAKWYLERAFDMLDCIDKRMDIVRDMIHYVNTHKN